MFSNPFQVAQRPPRTSILVDFHKILEYFDTIEKLQKNKEQKDVLKFKKALFLLKKFKNQEAKIILNELVKSDSKIKNLAEYILAE